jgi:exodeoxyribonuclease V alpha subunit
MQQTRAAPPATLDAVLERITYANEETGYTIARVATNRSSDLLTVVGALLGAQPGESLRLRGRSGRAIPSMAVSSGRGL